MNEIMKKMVIESEDYAGLANRLGTDLFEGYSEKFSNLLIGHFCDELKKQVKPQEEVNNVEKNLKQKVGLKKYF